MALKEYKPGQAFSCGLFVDGKKIGSGALPRPFRCSWDWPRVSRWGPTPSRP